MKPENDDEPLAVVIDLADARLAGPVVEAKQGPCAHTNVEVDVRAGTLECATCASRVDAIWWIRQLARRWDQQWIKPRKVMLREIADKQAKLEEMRLEEDRLRKRIARARKLDVEPARQPFSAAHEKLARERGHYVVRVQVETASGRGHLAVVACLDPVQAREVLDLGKRLAEADPLDTSGG